MGKQSFPRTNQNHTCVLAYAIHKPSSLNLFFLLSPWQKRRQFWFIWKRNIIQVYRILCFHRWYGIRYYYGFFLSLISQFLCLPAIDFLQWISKLPFLGHELIIGSWHEKWGLEMPVLWLPPLSYIQTCKVFNCSDDDERRLIKRLDEA